MTLTVENSVSERQMKLFPQSPHHHIPPQTVFNWEIISFTGSGSIRDLNARKELAQTLDCSAWPLESMHIQKGTSCCVPFWSRRRELSRGGRPAGEWCCIIWRDHAAELCCTVCQRWDPGRQALGNTEAWYQETGASKSRPAICRVLETAPSSRWELCWGKSWCVIWHKVFSKNIKNISSLNVKMSLKLTAEVSLLWQVISWVRADALFSFQKPDI